MRASFLLALLAAGLVSGCSVDTLTGRINPYRIDVRQGNFVDQDMLAQLKPGMSRDQVRFVLGTPLVVDPFRHDRWDYVYLYKPGRGEPEQRTVSVYFRNEVLDRVVSDVPQSAQAGGASALPAERGRVVEIPAAAAKR